LGRVLVTCYCTNFTVMLDIYIYIYIWIRSRTFLLPLLPPPTLYGIDGIVIWNSQWEAGEWPSAKSRPPWQCNLWGSVWMCLLDSERERKRERESVSVCLRCIFCHLYIWLFSTGLLLHKPQFGTSYWCFVFVGWAVLPEGAYWYSLANEIWRIGLKIKHSHEGTEIHKHLVVKTLGAKYRQNLRPL
jgi:hypothetical protein